MSQARYTPEQKFNIVLESLRDDRSISEICRGIAQSLFYKWRDKFFEGVRSSLSAKKKVYKAYEAELWQLKQAIGS